MTTSNLHYTYPMSSFIHRIARFQDTTVEITFNSGSTYTYYQVPLEIYENLVSAESKGKYFNSNRRYFSDFVRLETSV